MPNLFTIFLSIISFKISYRLHIGVVEYGKLILEEIFMKKLNKIALILLLTLIAVICLAFSSFAGESKDSIIEGAVDNITYKIYTDAQFMIVSGEGKIPDHMFNDLDYCCKICDPDYENIDNDDDYIVPLTDFEKAVSSVKTIIIEDGITEIGHAAFVMRGPCNLNTVIFPDTLVKIGENAFYDQNSLTNINFPESLEEIAARAFYYTGLRCVYVPENVNKLGDGVFDLCHELKSITFTKAVCSINYCKSLERVTYPFDYEDLPVVRNCDALKEYITPLSFGGKNIKITVHPDYDDIFYECKNIKSIILSDAAFAKFKKLKLPYIEISKELPEKLDKVTNLKCTASGNLTLTWSPVKNAGFYQVYRCNNKGKWVRIYAGKENTFTLKLNRNYYRENKFKVRACAFDGEKYVTGAFASVNTYRVGSADINITKVNKDKVTLYWSMSGIEHSKITGYQIFYKDVNSSKFKKYGNVNGTSYTMTNLKKGVYDIKIRAYYKYEGKIYYGKFSSNNTVRVA